MRILFSIVTVSEVGGKGKGKMSIYKRGPVNPGRWIKLDKKSRVKIEQSNRRWTFKEFEINGQDKVSLWESVAREH